MASLIIVPERHTRFHGKGEGLTGYGGTTPEQWPCVDFEPLMDGNEIEKNEIDKRNQQEVNVH
jgi:hypothetical protein